MRTTSTAPRSPIARVVAALASLAAGTIYLAIGLGFLSVGESTQEATTDLFGFGALMALVSAAVAVAVWLQPASRAVLGAVAVVQLIALFGYVAAAGVREPPFELWGVLIKAFQAIVLVAVVDLWARARHERSSTRRAQVGGAA
jgi:hypothetical protein